MSANRITTSKLKAMKAAGDKIVAATAWDYVSSAIADSAGIDLILVGDSLAMTIRGDDDTLAITLDDMIYHTRMVARACKNALVVGDMPFMSYQISPEQALESAGRFLKEGGARAVKIEGARMRAETIEKVVAAGIPVMGHIGLTPQSVHQFGGFKMQGGAPAAAKGLMEDARRLQEAGIFALVLECVPAPLSAYITGRLEVPTIGIGAGEGCDGQIQVTADVVGLTSGRAPKHAQKYSDLTRAWRAALRRYAREVREGAFPTEANRFEADAELLKAIDNQEI